jgi:ATP-dependent Clp protease adaptor protein ClpS
MMQMNHSNIQTAPLQEEDIDIDVLISNASTCQLILWNDEVNTFEWVIDTLIDVCGHTEEQAEQCALLIHTKGKYAVKNGDYDTLKPMKDEISERGIGVTIEQLAD